MAFVTNRKTGLSLRWWCCDSKRSSRRTDISHLQLPARFYVRHKALRGNAYYLQQRDEGRALVRRLPLLQAQRFGSRATTTMKCRCGSDISAARLRAIPSTRECTTCAAKHDVQKLQGFMSWEHKTAPFIVISTPEVVQEVLRNSRKTPRANLRLGNKSGAERFAGGTREFSDATVGANTPMENMLLRKARCHPDKPAVTPNGMCKECALLWYEVRKR